MGYKKSLSSHVESRGVDSARLPLELTIDTCEPTFQEGKYSYPNLSTLAAFRVFSGHGELQLCLRNLQSFWLLSLLGPDRH